MAPPNTDHAAPGAPGLALRERFAGHDDRITDLAWHPDGQHLFSVSHDCRVKCWRLGQRQPAYTLTGHSAWIQAIAVTGDGRFAVSAASDRALIVWDLQKREIKHWLHGHQDRVFSVAVTDDGRLAFSASKDSTIKVWDLLHGRELHTLGASRSGGVNTVTITPDNRLAISGTFYGVLRTWDIGDDSVRRSGIPKLTEMGAPVHDLVALSNDRVLSISSDGKMRLWNLHKRRVEQVIEGHTGQLAAASRSADDRLIATKALDGTVRLWDARTWQTLAVLDEPAEGHWPVGIAFHPTEPILATLDNHDRSIRIWDVDLTTRPLQTPASERSTHYRNAKVVLAGDTGVGKTGLGIVLRKQPFVLTESTHARHIWKLDRWEVPQEDGQTEIREIYLWDLAGQPGYRVFNQLSLHEVAVGLVVFDARSETEPFAGVSYWARALDSATRGSNFVKLLVAARTDRGTLPVSEARINEILDRYGFHKPCYQVSAKSGDGIAELAEKIRGSLDWDNIAVNTSPQRFHDIKSFLVRVKEAGRVLVQRHDLLQRYQAEKAGEQVARNAFDKCLSSLEAAGLIRRLSFGDWVLLQPELLDAYCASLALAARQEPDGLGFLSKEMALAGDFAMDQEHRLKSTADERLMLVVTIEEVVGRGLALTQPTQEGEMLVFPSEVRTDMPDYPGKYVRAMVLRFEGPVQAIYATLAVSLMCSPAFRREKLFRNAAVFHGPRGQSCGFAIDYPQPHDESRGRLTVFFAANVETDVKLVFLRFVNQHVQRLAFHDSVERERVYQCNKCHKVHDSDDVKWSREAGKGSIACRCGLHIPLDELADETAEHDRRVVTMENESREEQERQKRMAVLPERERSGTYHVFLCHNSADTHEVKRLDAKLRARGILPWMDENELLEGDQITAELEQIIDRVTVAAVIVGPNSLGPWQRREYNVFLRRHVESRGKGRLPKPAQPLTLFPVLLPGAPAISELPAFLRDLRHVDFRKGGLDDRNQMDRLVNAILGHGPEAELAGDFQPDIED